MATFYTHVKPELLQKHLRKTTLIGTLSLLPLLLSAIWVPAASLRYIGPLLVILWIAINFPVVYKYTRLRQLDRSPKRFALDDKTFPNISSIAYTEEGNMYGAVIVLTNGEKAFLPYYSKKCCLEMQKLLEARLEDIVELD